MKKEYEIQLKKNGLEPSKNEKLSTLPRNTKLIQVKKFNLHFIRHWKAEIKSFKTKNPFQTNPAKL